MALLSRASCDIASKMVTGRSAKTLFMEVMGRSAAGLGRQSRGLPGQHAPREMFVVSQSAGLRGQRRRYRSFPRPAGKNHLLALGIGNILRIEARKWNDDRAGIGFGRDLVRLADVDEKVAALGHSLRYLFRRQIVNLPLIRHSNPPSLVSFSMISGHNASRLFRGKTASRPRTKSEGMLFRIMLQHERIRQCAVARPCAPTSPLARRKSSAGTGRKGLKP